VRGLCLLSFLAVLLWTHAAAAQDPLVQAREAYERGARAYDEGRFREAVDELARADELVPNVVALELALHAALKHDDPVAGMALVERAEARATEGHLGELAARGRNQFAPRVGQLIVTCPRDTECRAKVDGIDVSAGAPRWMAAGDHEVELFVEDAVQRRQVHIDGGARVEITPMVPAPSREAAPAPKPRPRPAKAPVASVEGERISPAWFWIGVGVTAVGVAGIIASGVDALNKREDFLAGPSEATEAAGRSAQLRTNILLGVTGALAAGTVALGVVTYRY